MSVPRVLIDLPRGSARAALRAALMGMRIPPETLPAEPALRRRALAQALAQPSTVAFIDISHRPDAPATGLLNLFSDVPAGAARARVMLTRLAGGAVSEADRRWMRELGFADLLPELDAQDCEGRLREALDWAARHTGLAPLPPPELARFAKAGAPAAEAAAPRERIRRATGAAAEAWVEQLGDWLDIQDRRWLLTTYPSCFVGREAVSRIAAGLSCSRDEAVALGQALLELGLVVHVMQEHPFLDDDFFYRLAWPERPPAVSLAAAWDTLSLPGGLQAATRRYLGKAYADCWIGQQAVDLLCQRHHISRLEAWLLLHRLMQFGLFEHVTRDRPFVDGEFFYRFAATGG